MSSNGNFLKLSYERQLISKLNIDIDQINNENNNEIFMLLLKNENYQRNVVIYFLNKLLPNITNFNDICGKYFQILIDEYKNQINKAQINNNISLITSINGLTNFIKILSKNQEKYNEKHKNIVTQFPQFIQLLFKTFQQNYNNLSQKLIESYLILILSFIEYYPTLIRNYQNSLEKIIKNIFLNYIINNIYDMHIIEIATIIYTNLYKLSPNMNNKFNDYVKNIINNIKFYYESFRPKNLSEEEPNKNASNIEEKNNLFFIGMSELIIDNKNLIQATKVINILFNALKNLFLYMICNTYIEIDFNEILTLFNEIFNTYESKEKEYNLSNNIIINGLSKNNYELFLNDLCGNILDILIYFISNYSRFIYNFNIPFSKFVNRILLNQNYFDNFFLHKKIISFFSTIILYFNDILSDEIDLIIYKHLYDNLLPLYLNYLQENDKTILQVNDIYFKASNVKNIILNDKKTKENRILLIEYFKMLFNYCEIITKINKINNKNILGGIIDLIILPPFAKFIFNLDEEIKNIIINILEICVKKNLIFINKIKLYNFLTNFYFFDGNLKYKAQSLINLLKIKDDDLNNEIYLNPNINDITGQIIDFDKKIKEYLINANKKLENIKLENTQINNDNNNNINKEKIDEKIIKSNDKEMLNKKRKNKTNNKDISERKGNNKKNEALVKKKKKELIEEINLNIKENRNEENNEGKNLNEDMQINEDNIDIPDIV